MLLAMATWFGVIWIVASANDMNLFCMGVRATVYLDMFAGVPAHLFVGDCLIQACRRCWLDINPRQVPFGDLNEQQQRAWFCVFLGCLMYHVILCAIMLALPPPETCPSGVLLCVLLLGGLLISFLGPWLFYKKHSYVDDGHMLISGQSEQPEPLVLDTDIESIVLDTL
jgi:hypothetical protein